jgi:hypothetical protein
MTKLHRLTGKIGFSTVILALACGGSDQTAVTAAAETSSSGAGSTAGSEAGPDTGIDGDTELSTSTDGDTTSGASEDASDASDTTDVTGRDLSTDDGTTDDDATGEEALDCVDAQLGGELGEAVLVASVAGHGDKLAFPCSVIQGEDYVAVFEAPYRGVFRFELDQGCDDSFPLQCPHVQAALMLLDGGCDGLRLACAESFFLWAGGVTGVYPAMSSVALEAGQTVLVAVKMAVSHEFEVAISGIPAEPGLACIDEDLGSTVGQAVGVGDGADASDDYLVCGIEPNPERMYLFSAPATATYRFVGTQAVPGVFLPGCTHEIETYLGCGPGCFPTMECGGGMVPGVPGPNDTAPGRPVNLVAGQQVGISLNVSPNASYQLDIIANTTPGETCCSPRTFGAGCSVPAIEACVCDVDSFCCDVFWDMNCSGRAVHYCDASCID